MEKRESWDEYFLRHVYLAASRSKDPRTQIGAVVVRDNVIISEGYNGFPRGVIDNPEHYLDRQIKLAKTVHAEMNSVLNCARIGVSSLNAIIYTNGTPCENCAKSIIQAGIKEVIVHKEWEHLFLNNPNSHNWIKSVELSRTMFNEARVSVRFVSAVFDVKLRLDGKIIEI